METPYTTPVIDHRFQGRTDRWAFVWGMDFLGILVVRCRSWIFLFAPLVHAQ